MRLQIMRIETLSKMSLIFRFNWSVQELEMSQHVYVYFLSTSFSTICKGFLVKKDFLEKKGGAHLRAYLKVAQRAVMQFCPRSRSTCHIRREPWSYETFSFVFTLREGLRSSLKRGMIPIIAAPASLPAQIQGARKSRSSAGSLFNG